MIRSFRRRFGAALVLSLAAASFSSPCAFAADAAKDAAADAAREAQADKAARPAAAAKNSNADAPKPASPQADPATKDLRHGARSKASDGSTLIWDKVTGVFVSPDRPDTYWIADRFYQYKDGVWLKAGVLAGPWEVIAQHMVPEVARGRHGVPKQSVKTKLPSGREAVYYARLKAFKIAGRKGVFLFDATYYRYDNGVWLESASDDGPWTAASAKRLPSALRRGVPLPESGTKVSLPSGETLVSEGDSGVFAVQDKPNLVYFDGAFYERRQSQWFVSNKSATGFEELANNKVPGAVRTNYHNTGGGSGKARRADKGTAANKDKAERNRNAATRNSDAAQGKAPAKKKAADKDNAATEPTAVESQ